MKTITLQAQTLPNSWGPDKKSTQMLDALNVSRPVNSPPIWKRTDNYNGYTYLIEYQDLGKFVQQCATVGCKVVLTA